MKAMAKALTSSTDELRNFVTKVFVGIQKNRSVVKESLERLGYSEDDIMLVLQSMSPLLFGGHQTFSGDAPLLDICERMLSKEFVEPIDAFNLVYLVNKNDVLVYHLAVIWGDNTFTDWGIGEHLGY